MQDMLMLFANCDCGDPCGPHWSADTSQELCRNRMLLDLSLSERRRRALWVEKKSKEIWAVPTWVS